MGSSGIRSFSVDLKLVILALVVIAFLSSFYGSQMIGSNHLDLPEEEGNRMLIESNRVQLRGTEVFTRNLKQEQKIKPETRESNSKFMLVTGERSTPCGTSEGSFILMKSYKNKVDYCSFHNCRVWFTLETWNPGFRGTWARYPLLKHLMILNPGIEWFMWMDGDAIFTDLEFSIPFQDYQDRDLIIPGYWDKVYGDNPDWVGLNAGVFLIRNSNWSLGFLERWMKLNSEDSTVKINEEIPTRPQSWPADDQSALVYLLRKLSRGDRERTFLELRYTLHGYWELIVDTYESLLSPSSPSSIRPFVTHFCGCSFCGGEIHPRCIAGFHRAYNFADDQLLERAGFKHLDLNSTEVVKTFI